MSSRAEPVKVSETKMVSESEDRVEAFQSLDRRDEEQILAEMRGETLKTLVYDINIRGKRITNLSYAGVKEAVRRRGNIEILDLRVEETEKDFRALVKVRDHDKQLDVLGASSSDKSQPFAYTLAVNKAERNAFAKLIPAKWLAVLVDEYLQRQSKPVSQLVNSSTSVNTNATRTGAEQQDTNQDTDRAATTSNTSNSNTTPASSTHSDADGHFWG